MSEPTHIGEILPDILATLKQRVIVENQTYEERNEKNGKQTDELTGRDD